MHFGTAALFAIFAFTGVVVPYALWRVAWIRTVAPLGMIQLAVALLSSPLCLGRALPPLPPGIFEPLSWIAVMLFLFVAGGHAQLDRGVAVQRKHLGIAVASLVIPLAVGAVLGQWLRIAHPDFAGPLGGGAVFSFAVAICVAVTALPMLAILVADLDLYSSAVGRAALVVAVMHDMALWLLLAAVLLIARSAEAPLVGVAALFLAVPVAIVAIFIAIRALAHWLWERTAKTDRAALVSACGLLLCCATISDVFGLHLAIGAFLAGTIAPRDMFRRAAAAIEPISTIVLLPFFFLAAAQTVPASLDVAHLIEATFVVTTVALVAKFLAGAVSARLAGFSAEDSLVLGSLLQCKGLMEIVAVIMLRDAKIVSAEFVASFIVMSLVTTLAAKPLVGCSRALGRLRQSGFPGPRVLMPRSGKLMFESRRPAEAALAPDGRRLDDDISGRAPIFGARPQQGRHSDGSRG